MTVKFDIIGGLDIGNGYVKGKLSVNGGDPVLVDMPSCVSYISQSKWLPTEPDAELMADLCNELDCEISSPAIPPADRGRIVMGKRAADSPDYTVSFNIDDRVPKCLDPLSVELACGICASLALNEQWKAEGGLPADKLEVHAFVGTALPIADYMAYRETYRKRFMEGVHTVHVRNFERDVTVDVIFDEVTVLAEGAAAQYAITDLGEKFLDAALAKAKMAGLPVDEAESGATLLSYANTIGVDIGDGTVNFPVFRNGKVSVESSSSIDKGYGTVLEKVIETLRDKRSAYTPKSRKDLSEFLLKENLNPRDAKIKAGIMRVVDDETREFVREIVAEVKRVLSKNNLMVDVVYVYGGGSDATREMLYPALIEAAKLDEDVYTPVVYMESGYSRNLNRNGLAMVANLVRENKKQGNQG